MRCRRHLPAARRRARRMRCRRHLPPCWRPAQGRTHPERRRANDAAATPGSSLHTAKFTMVPGRNHSSWTSPRMAVGRLPMQSSTMLQCRSRSVTLLVCCCRCNCCTSAADARAPSCRKPALDGTVTSRRSTPKGSAASHSTESRAPSMPGTPGRRQRAINEGAAAASERTRRRTSGSISASRRSADTSWM